MRPRSTPIFYAALAIAIAIFVARGAQADDGGDVTVLPPAPPPPTAVTIPVIVPEADLKGFVGKRISSIEVVSSGEMWGAQGFPAVKSVHAGDLLTPDAARSALDEILATSRFARAQAVAIDEGGGSIVLQIRVTARKIIETLRVDLGGAQVDREEFLREADFAEGGELVGADLADKQDRLEAFLARHGYPDATVSLTTRLTDDPQRVFLLLEVKAGAPRTIDKRYFFVLNAPREALTATTDAYTVKAGDRADETQLDLADTNLEQRLRMKGYHHADVSHDLVRYRGKAPGTGKPFDIVALRVRVAAGSLYLPRFEGNDSFDADALTGSLALDTAEGDLTPQHLADKVRDFYQKHGFFDVEVAVEERGGSSDATHFLVFKIVEHPRVLVVARSYPCLKEDEIKDLGEGGPRSATQIGNEIDSYLEEELPGADIVKNPGARGSDVTFLNTNPNMPTGARPDPIDLDPDGTYVADTYDRAILHVQELYRNEGFLHAEVGPVEVVRRKCDPRSPAGQCVPMPLPQATPDECTYDATDLPLPVTKLDSRETCVPDPLHGLECEQRVYLKIPVKLGPRTFLYDLQFVGARTIDSPRLVEAADLTMGDPANALKIEEARRRVVDLYKEEGYAYVDVKTTLEESLDHTRARVRFDVAEGEKVIVRQIVIVGNEITREGVIRRRIALEVGEPYRTSLVRKTLERVATLNVFTSVNVALADPFVPQKNKTVVVTVQEAVPKYVEVRPGFSTGEGIRITNEFGDRNVFGTAIAVSTRLQASYLPDAFIFDSQVRQNFQKLEQQSGIIARIAGRITLRADFPEIGLGPLVRMGIDGVFARTLNRDFVLTKKAFIPTFFYRPARQVQVAISPSIEQNDVEIFQNISATNAQGQSCQSNGGQQLTLDQYLTCLAQSPGNADLARLLRVPDGTSNVIAQRVAFTWDRRNDPFNPHKGTYYASSVEHDDWYPLEQKVGSSFNPGEYQPLQGHTLRFQQTFAGYIPIGSKLTLAAEVRIGTNVQLTPGSTTYPDRLFFLGGLDSMRGWTQDSFIPQDYVDKVAAEGNKPATDPTKFTAASIPIRGGNLMINPKVELRFPFSATFGGLLFADFGNLWVDATYPFETGKFPIRAAVGPGILVYTPIGPLSLAYGINVYRHSEYEDFGALQFSIGLF
ncbi:MAG: POTRA domain-containing protein [Polyangiaceae bacterium]